MFLLDSPAVGVGDLIFSASDLVTASECEYRTLRLLDQRLGRSPKPNFPADEMMARAAELGDDYEKKVLAELVAEFGLWDSATGKGVAKIERASNTQADLEAKRDETLAVLRAGADVVFQATFFDGSLVGFADFLVRQPDGSYAVWDTKLARHAKVSALLQLAAYGDQLLASAIPVAPLTDLVLGNGKHSSHRMADLLPVFRERREHFLALTAAHRAQPSTVQWLQPGITYCGTCDYCKEQIKATDDLLLVNGMTSSQRNRLRAEGIETVEQLANISPDKAKGPLARLRDQARMQAGIEPVGGTVSVEGNPLSYKVLPSVSHLPAPSFGDIFFDFEGDPLWQDPVDGSWGIEYLFGSIEAPVEGAAPGTAEVFRPFWAHSRGQERKAFQDFVAYVQQRRLAFPDMHVYHYAPYEKSALRALSVEFGGAEEAIIDQWLREGLLVDLLDTVRQSLRISASSYSLKKLEPFYMEAGRGGSVKDAGASVVAYAEYCKARDEGAAGDAEQAAKAVAELQSISDYNEYDCLSTLRLRDWLLEIGAAQLVDTWTEGSGKLKVTTETARQGYEPTPDELKLGEFIAALTADSDHTLSDNERAVAMVEAAASYHRREDKQFWWDHFDRLEKGPSEWSGARNLFAVEDAELVSDWVKPTPRSNEARTIKLTGTASEGSDFKPGTKWFGMYHAPLPDDLGQRSDVPVLRDGAFGLEIEEDISDPATPEITTLLVKQRASKNLGPHAQFPMALTPDQPVNTASIRAALATLAAEVAQNLPDSAEATDDVELNFPKNPGLEILRKAKPRLRDGGDLPQAEAPLNAVTGDVDPAVSASAQLDYVSAITEAVAKLDRSYLAVQGPPGTGKTHVGSHVIAKLVEQGWKVGVVGQSHAVVENMLTAAIQKAGVDPERVGKKLASPHEVPWKVVDDKKFGQLLNSSEGALIGGTAWTMTGANVPAGSLDLLVIDEAGQFSLANTLAVAQATKNLLLLGDPQQLPQVSQGSHPQPVDESALGWLSAGHATLPPWLGYFLADSWRMHPDLCRAVSHLSYEDKLVSAPAASDRFLEAEAAGVETVMVTPAAGSGHENKQSSPEEALAVVEQVRKHLGLAWTGGLGESARPLQQNDFLVVAAYNAQVNLVREVLKEAGLAEVRVGTVDKFQGQEAPVVIVSMACAEPASAPRGMEFLLNRNRINVAVSRGQWRAIILRSPALTNFMPSRPSGMAELGAFIGLCRGDH